MHNSMRAQSIGVLEYFLFYIDAPTFCNVTERLLTNFLPVRNIRREEEKYYELLISYSRQHLMLFPYHLQDMLVRGLRLTPFQYYCNLITDLMTSEKSYDTLPNFAAADCAFEETLQSSQNCFLNDDFCIRDCFFKASHND